MWPDSTSTREINNRMITNETIGQVIRKLREKKTKLGQEAFADRAKIHRTHMSKIESGTGSIQLNTLCKIADALGIRAGDILNKADRLRSK